MKLTYRGAQYDYNPPMLEVTESDLSCRYRGQATPYTFVRNVPIPQPAQQLTYRGVAYQTNRQGQIVQLADAQGMGQVSAPASTQRTGISLASLRSKLMGASPAAEARRQLLKESSELHQDSMMRSLQHRISVAKEQGNESLVQQLETEMRQNA